MAERLLRLAELAGRDNLMAGTDCGFAQTPFTLLVLGPLLERYLHLSINVYGFEWLMRPVVLVIFALAV